MPFSTRRSISTARFLGVALGLSFSVGVNAQPVPDGGVPADGGVVSRVIAPRVTTPPRPEYPRGADGRRVDVDLIVTVDVSGRVSAVEVLGHVPADALESFDDAAVRAARAMVFEPARRDGQAIPVRVRYHMAITAPVVGTESGSSTEELGLGAEGLSPHTHIPAHPAQDHHHHPSVSAPTQSRPVRSPLPSREERRENGPAAGHTDEDTATVHGHFTPPPRAASDFELSGDALTSAPRASAGDLLSSAPGFYVSRPEGDAVAHQVFLRGFDAEHGQDIEFSAGPVPVNLPSHIHGQGYADLNFIIPEVVRSLRVTEGTYNPRQGDFAVAGSAHFDLGVPQRGYLVRGTYGSFNTARVLGLWAPRGESESTFAAVSLRRTDGFGQNRGGMSGSVMAQYAFHIGRYNALLHAAAYGARAGLAGVLRQDDVDAGRVGFYDSYADPSANAQGAFATRAQAAMTLERREANGRQTEFGLWALATGFRQRANFTGYTQRSITHPEWVGRGDLIEQRNDDVAFGATASHRTRTLRPSGWASGHFAMGLSFRADRIDQTQNLLQAPQNETWDQRVDAAVQAYDLGGWFDLDWQLSRYLHLRGGLRADVLFYDVDDRLGNFTPAFRRESHILGFRRTALGLALGPRATVELAPSGWSRVFVSYGEGFRSPQARQLSEGESAPFAKVRSVEVGARFRPTRAPERLTVTAALYGTFLSTDLVFDPSEARLERVGPTRRLGAVASVVARPWRWLFASASVTWVHATLEEPPPATPENPSPPFSKGQLLPYVPPVVVRLDARARGRLFSLSRSGVVGTLGAGFTYLSPRPLPFAQFASPVAVLDVSGSLAWRFIELGLECFNIAGTQYAATAYSFVSNWQTTSVPSLVPARHFAAGAPRTVLATVSLRF